ncbi:hypothetical protein [Desulfonema magnum]|nr:hypothetical protein [Desulfonema magnum]
MRVYLQNTQKQIFVGKMMLRYHTDAKRPACIPTQSVGTRLKRGNEIKAWRLKRGNEINEISEISELGEIGEVGEVGEVSEISEIRKQVFVGKMMLRYHTDAKRPACIPTQSVGTRLTRLSVGTRL